MNMPEQEQLTPYYMAGKQPQADPIQTKNEPQSSNGDVAGVGNLDRVREILFGSHMRNYEKRLNRLEEYLVKECANLRDETRKRLDSLEDYIKKEFDLVTARLKIEKAERQETVEELSHNLKDKLNTLDKKIAQLDEQIIQNERNLRQQTLDLSKNWNDEMRQKSEEILAVLEREAGEIRKNKTDRSTLVALLTEMARRLNNEFDDR
jgi:serine/threonine protein kinase